MVREIVKGSTKEGLKILQTVSKPSNIKEDKQLYIDLLETANFHKEKCVGLSAVQIGEHKRAVCVLIGNNFELIINPLVISKSKETYETEEGCLSLEGTRKVKRHEWIEVFYSSRNGKTKKQKFYGYTAEILQHEIDHCNGVLI